jgi:hypothetical protein
MVGTPTKPPPPPPQIKVPSQILDARKEIQSKFRTEDPPILGATIQNLVTWATWHLTFVHP